MLDQYFNRSAPLAAIRAAAPEATVRFRNGSYASEAALAASQADVAIVFATQYQTEGYDVPDLSLPDGQDALIAAVAAANPNTIVVLQTGGPVTMPWKDQVKAVVEAWYPGARGGEAIADVLFGKVNPSGRLPVTFPQSEAQLPRPKLDGLDTVEPNFVGIGAPGQKLDVDYDIEGSDLGYRWFAREGKAPLFAFGHGLSYTSFAHEGLTVARDGDRLVARFTVRNTGAARRAPTCRRSISPTPPGGRCAGSPGFAKVELAPGEARAGRGAARMAHDRRMAGRRLDRRRRAATASCWRRTRSPTAPRRRSCCRAAGSILSPGTLAGAIKRACRIN